MIKRTLFLLACSFLFACTMNDKDISARIEAQFYASDTEPINLAVLGPDSWERVCVLPPYTDNKQAEEILGFKWNSDSKTSIGGSDGINVLVFVRGSEVVSYTEHPRNKGDFARMKPRCLERKHATVVRLKDPDPRNGGWVFLVANQ